jgi:hypothetical protein
MQADLKPLPMIMPLSLVGLMFSKVKLKPTRHKPEVGIMFYLVSQLESQAIAPTCFVHIRNLPSNPAGRGKLYRVQLCITRRTFDPSVSRATRTKQSSDSHDAGATGVASSDFEIGHGRNTNRGNAYRP